MRLHLAMIAIWSTFLFVDLYAPANLNPPPEPVLIGREAWELG